MRNALHRLYEHRTMRDVNLTRLAEPSQATWPIFSRIFGFLHFMAGAIPTMPSLVQITPNALILAEKADMDKTFLAFHEVCIHDDQ